MNFSVTMNGVTVTTQLDPDTAAKLAAGGPTAISPAQWAAFIAAILQAILSLFTPPTPGHPAAKPAAK